MESVSVTRNQLCMALATTRQLARSLDKSIFGEWQGLVSFFRDRGAEVHKLVLESLRSSLSSEYDDSMKDAFKDKSRLARGISKLQLSFFGKTNLRKHELFLVSKAIRDALHMIDDDKTPSHEETAAIRLRLSKNEALLSQIADSNILKISTHVDHYNASDCHERLALEEILERFPID